MNRRSLATTSLALLLSALAFAAGYLSGVNESREQGPSVVPTPRATTPSRPDQRPAGHWNPLVAREIRELEQLGYLSGTRVANDAPTGVVEHDPSRAAPGLNLYVSGHGPEARLIDMEGRLVHRWAKSWAECFPGLPIPEDGQSAFWRKVFLLPGGDLLAVFEPHGVIRLDASSKLLWAKANHAHHDLWSGDGETIFVLSRTAHLRRDIHPTRPVLEDFVLTLNGDGEEVGRVSLLDLLSGSSLAPLMDLAPEHGDILHTNTLVPAGLGFGEDHFLVAFPTLNTVAIVDLKSKRIPWSLVGVASYPHDPNPTSRDSILLFDNGRRTKTSRAIEIDFRTREVIWSYPSRPDRDLYSGCCSTAQPLENGNRLVTFSELGRAVEVTAEGEPVWIFETPHRIGGDEPLVASLWEVERISETRLDWLEH